MLILDSFGLCLMLVELVTYTNAFMGARDKYPQVIAHRGASG